MISTNAKLAQLLAVVATLPPAATANTERFTGVVNMGNFHQAVAVVQLGDMASEAITVKAYACKADGSGAVALTVNSPAALAASAEDNDNKQLVLNVRAEDLLESGLSHIKFGVVTGGATGGPVAAVVLGHPRSGWGKDSNVASVVAVAG